MRACVRRLTAVKSAQTTSLAAGGAAPRINTPFVPVSRTHFSQTTSYGRDSVIQPAPSSERNLGSVPSEIAETVMLLVML